MSKLFIIECKSPADFESCIDEVNRKLEKGKIKCAGLCWSNGEAIGKGVINDGSIVKLNAKVILSAIKNLKTFVIYASEEKFEKNEDIPPILVGDTLCFSTCGNILDVKQSGIKDFVEKCIKPSIRFSEKLGSNSSFIKMIEMVCKKYVAGCLLYKDGSYKLTRKNLFSCYSTDMWYTDFHTNRNKSVQSGQSWSNLHLNLY